MRPLVPFAQAVPNFDAISKTSPYGGVISPNASVAMSTWGSDFRKRCARRCQSIAFPNHDHVHDLLSEGYALATEAADGFRKHLLITANLIFGKDTAINR